ncbi:hypothetical protein [Salipiger abyssi]|uniref:hypothetical protein n=1 Tax=Salipiger abyssi TaxID=1250539 RepID=UPI001F301753|nr:hypothetical protein [Salipiger abyssi]
MIRAAVLMAALLLGSLPAFAQEIRVRSGEHGDFTRLVLDLPRDMQWRLSQPEARQAEIRFETGGYVFDFSDVFARIDRARVADLSVLAEGSGIRIDLACACAASAFLLRERMLVVDIRAGTPPLPEPSPPSPASKALSELRVGPDVGIGPPPAENALLPAFSLPTIADTGSVPAEAPAIDPGAFERMLSEQLATAATEGLLNPALRDLLRPNAARDASPEVYEDSVSGTGDAASTARTAIEAAIAGQDPYDLQSRIRIGGTACVRDDRLDLASWGGDETLETIIPELRARLYGEFDRLDPEVLIALARAYLHIGFGAEARALLELDPELRDPVLVALAGIVDGEADGAGVFAGQTDCDGFAALWALAGAPALPEGAEIDGDAIRRAFEKLPLNLRSLLGPRLATRLAEEGQPGVARNLLLQLARATGETSEDMVYSAAKIDRLEGAVDEARDVLEAFAARAGEHAPDAVAAAIEIATERREPVGARMTELSAAYATELRETEKGPELWRAHLRAMIANGEYEEGFASFWNADDIPESIRVAAAGEALILLTEQAPDTAFLKQTVSRAAAFDGLVEPKATLAVAERLLNLGLSDEAASWADLTGADRAARRTRLLTARIHLARSEPEAAEIALIGLQGEDVLRLRAEARRMMGDFDYARTAYDKLGEPQRARSAAWLAGDWPALDDAQDTLGATAALVRADLPNADETLPSLALAEQLAGTGAETRAALRALLEDTRLPSD